MGDEERIARALEDQLRTATAELEPHTIIQRTGEGVHWHLDVATGTRRCRIHCFWYGPISGLMLGMNPANARVEHHVAHQSRRGPEYLITFREGDQRIAGGRVHVETDAVASVAAWCDGGSIDELAERWPYVDATRRGLRALLPPIEAACGDTARCVIEQTSGYQLWIYSRRATPPRSCRVHPTPDGSVAVTFLLGLAPVAFAQAVTVTDAGALVAVWMRGATLAELARAGATVEPHADLIERGEPAAWHWNHFRERIADPDDVLAALRPLLERLAERPVVTSFFTFSSLDRLCFSASSHYPWVDDGLPIVASSTHGVIYVDKERCSLDQAADAIEARLAAYPIKPFFGSEVMLTVAALEAELAAHGTTLHAELVQRTAWFRTKVIHDDRWCDFSDTRVEFRDASDDYVTTSFEDRSSAIAAIRRWLEDRCALEELGEPKRDAFDPD